MLLNISREVTACFNIAIDFKQFPPQISSGTPVKGHNRMNFWIDQSANHLQNLESKIVRMYLIHILRYLTLGKLLSDQETQNGDAQVRRK